VRVQSCETAHMHRCRGHVWGGRAGQTSRAAATAAAIIVLYWLRVGVMQEVPNERRGSGVNRWRWLGPRSVQRVCIMLVLQLRTLAL
jgi:hypothetical protein